jgi:hypothetical protein
MPKSKATLVPDDELPANDPQRCTGNEAVIRLVACWVSRCLDDPTFARRVKLADFIAEDAVSAVMDGNLLREFSPAESDLRIHELTLRVERHRRQRAMIAAWAQPRGRLQ